jgi:hypothetical protein
MIRLTRLKIDRFRNVKPGTDLRFGPTFNVLLGKNATGKSTLLDLVAAVTNDDLSAYAKEDAGFDLAWWLENGEDEIEVRAVRTPVTRSAVRARLRDDREFDDTLTVVVRTGGSEVGRLEVTGTRGSWKPRGEPEGPFDVRAGVAERDACRRALIGALTGGGKVASPRLGELLHTVEALGIFMEGVRVGRFDEATGALESITRSPIELRRQGLGSVASHNDWHTDVASALRASPEASAVPFDQLGSVSKIPPLLGFTSGELRPRMLQLSQDGENTTTTYQGFDCLFRRADGSRISQELLSFGQKRLFSFFWYLAVREELPVVADELLNGLHYEWIEVCLEPLYDRQSFLATQGTLLLDHIPIESVEAVRTTFIRCSIEDGPNGRKRMAWRNFDEEEAERFFIAYQTGIQQVSEVLRTEGLW